MIVLVNLQNQINKGYDSERKADLHKIQKAFNEYYNDKGCYPPLTVLNICGSTGTPDTNPIGLSPYLPKIPCDPKTKKPYLYEPVDPTNICSGYKVLTGLFDLADPAITSVGCTPSAGCGYSKLFNWGLAEGGVVPTGPAPTPTPYPSPIPGLNACSPGILPGPGYCNHYDNPAAFNCPVTFSDRYCLNQCGNSANWCQ